MNDEEPDRRRGRTFDQAVELLYRCVPEYSNIRDLESHSCPHCRLGPQIEPLLVDRATIGPEHLIFYGTKAMTTCGTVDHFRHFLPRLFETCDAVGGRGPSIEAIADKLGYAEWRTWPEVEVEAITSTLLALLDETVSEPAGIAVSSCYELLDQTEWIDWLMTLGDDALVWLVADQGDGYLISGRPERFLDDVKMLNLRLGPGRLRQLLEDDFFRREGYEADVLSNTHHLLDRRGLLP